MFQTFANFFRVADIRKKIIFTLLMLIVYRIGTFIPVPHVDVKAFDLGGEASIFGVLDVFGGGALANFSIFAMGIMPYITASIIVQLLQMDVVPKFSEWSKQGEVGRRKLAQFTRYFTVVLAFFQAVFMSIGFNNLMGGALIKDPGITTYLFIAVVLTAGTSFLMWLGEQITSNGVGNGISIIIFAGIVSAIPTTLQQIYTQKIQDAGDGLFMAIVTLALIGVAIIAIIVAVIYVQEALRKIPIQYAKQVSGNSKYPVGGHNTHLPLKVNSAGVIPIIFSMAFIVTPPTIASFFPQEGVALWIVNNFNYNQPIGMVLYAALIIAFCYFYTFIQVNPEQMADNLKKQGGYIPGIRPGRNTEEYVKSVLYRLTFAGSIFLAIVAVMPVFFTKFAGLPQSAQIGGTSMLILIGVALETHKQLESQLVKRH